MVNHQSVTSKNAGTHGNSLGGQYVHANNYSQNAVTTSAEEMKDRPQYLLQMQLSLVLVT